MKFTWRQPTLNPPLPVLLGDVLKLEADGTLGHYRGGVKIGSRALGLPGPVAAINPADGTPVTAADTLTHLFYFQEQKMPGQTVACTGVTENQTTDVVTFKYSNGNNVEYANWGAVGEMADTIDADSVLAEKMLAAKAYRMSPDGANKTTQVGAQMTLNFTADNPVTYTEPL